MELSIGRGCDVTLTTTSNRRLRLVEEAPRRRLTVTIYFTLSLVMQHNVDLSRESFFETLTSEISDVVDNGDLANATNEALQELLGSSYTAVVIDDVATDEDSVSFIESGGGIYINNGECSDNVYRKCVENIESHDGDWAYCDMCMCEEYESYGGSGSCGANDMLYACYLSTSQCKSKLRLSWIIGFAGVGVFICCTLCTCVFLCMRSKNKASVGALTVVQ